MSFLVQLIAHASDWISEKLFYNFFDFGVTFELFWEDWPTNAMPFKDWIKIWDLKSNLNIGFIFGSLILVWNVSYFVEIHPSIQWRPKVEIKFWDSKSN